MRPVGGLHGHLESEARAESGACSFGYLRALPGALRAQQQPALEIDVLTDQGWVEYDYHTRLATITNGGVLVRYRGSVLTAERATINWESEEVIADGRVRIQQGDQIWAGDLIRYNFKTRQMETEQFRTGRTPVFAAGCGGAGDQSPGAFHQDHPRR